MTHLHIGTEERFLTVKLTDEERRCRADRAGELAEQSGKAKREHESVKETAGRLKKDYETKAEEAARLLGIYRAGLEDRQVEVRIEFDEVEKELLFIRSDTEAIVEARKPTPEDWRRIDAARQTELKGIGGAPAGKRGRKPAAEEQN